MLRKSKIVPTIVLLVLVACSISAQEFKVIVQQISVTRSPMISDSLVLNGSIGKDFHISKSADSLNLKSGLWNVASGIYSKPPNINATFPDSIKRYEKNVYVSAIVNDINGVENVALHVQFGGASDPIIIPMEMIDDSTYRVSIDDSLRTVMNFRGQIVTEDGMFNISKTEQNTPHLQFAKTELSMKDSIYSFYPDGLPSGRWRMFSFPGNLDRKTINKSNLEDGHVFYDWDPINKNWFKPDSIALGRGYWFKHNYSQPVVFDNKDTTGYSIPLKDYTIELHQGSNMVASPFSFPVKAVMSEGVSLPYKYGDGEKDGWADTTVFEPWAGYAVYSPTSTGTITFTPFDEIRNASKTTESGWRFELDLIGTQVFDRTGAIGRLGNAAEQEDIYDVPLLPSPQNSLFITLDVNSNGEYGFSTDFRSIDEFNGVWDVQIRGSGEPGPVFLSGSMDRSYPSDLHISLIDISSRTVINDFIQSRLQIEQMITGQYDLKIIAGDRSYVLQMLEDILADIPEEFALGQNYPNPFNPITNINFSVPRTGTVSLVIYNIMGQKIKTLVSGNMKYGYHTVNWNGLDQLGRQVSSGVYFSELRAKGFRQTKKMLMLK